jgi:hypothetical protein
VTLSICVFSYHLDSPDFTNVFNILTLCKRNQRSSKSTYYDWRLTIVANFLPHGCPVQMWRDARDLDMALSLDSADSRTY